MVITSCGFAAQVAGNLCHSPNTLKMSAWKHSQQPEKAGRGKRRMLPAFHHRVRPRTLMTSVEIPFYFTLHVADINVFQRWLPDFNGPNICPLLKLGHFRISGVPHQQPPLTILLHLVN